MAAMLVRPRNTEKTSAVVGEAEDSGKAATQPATAALPPAGHGRNGAEAFSGAQKVEIAHQNLKHGDRCPECGEGNVYSQKESKVLVRIVGQAPLAATVYALERLRCGACGQVFTAQEPEGVGPEKYDETAAAMIAQLKYGSGIPFYRLEKLEGQLGKPYWPKRIDFGRDELTFENGRKTGLSERKIRSRFWPGTKTGENVAGGPLCPRLHQ